MSQSKIRKNKQKKQPGLPVLVTGAVVVLIVAIFGVWMLTSLGDDNPATGLPMEISVQEANQQRQAGAFMLDVREPSEWAEFHMPGATLIPLAQLPDRLSEVPADQPIVVVCRSGNRSATGRDILLEAGYENVTSMAGGMTAWRNAGYEVAAGE